MNVLIATNSDYFMPSRVLFHSLLKNNPCPIRLFVFYSRLTEDEKNILRHDAEESGHAEVCFVCVDRDDPAGAPWRLQWISVETYYRLYAQELLPEDVDRFLYLDGDVIVRGSLEEFYEQDMEGSLIAACCIQKDGGEPPADRSDPFPKDLRYFNAGVLLYDLKAQRACIDPSVYREIAECFGDRLKFGDQDILNHVFYRRVKEADHRIYNMMPSWIEDEDMLRRVRILHFNGFAKPWRYTYDTKWAECFWEYADDFPEYRVLKPGILAAQKQYTADKARRTDIVDMLRSRENAGKENNGEAEAASPQVFDENAHYQLADGARLIRTGTQNMLLMDPQHCAVFDGLLRLNETGAFLTECLKQPQTADGLAQLLLVQGRHSLPDARANARNLLKLLQEYRMIRAVSQLRRSC